MSTLIMWHNRFSESESEAVEAHILQYRDSKSKKPRHRDSKAEKHDIEIPRLKATTSSFRGILTLMPPDTNPLGG